MLKIVCLTLALVTLDACHRDEPKTRYWMDVDSYMAQLHMACAEFMMNDSLRTRLDGSMPEAIQRFHSERCSLRGIAGAGAGFTTIATQGSRFTYIGDCAAHIGPSPIVSPVSPELILGFVHDAALAEKLRPLFQGIDPRRAYHVSATIDGVHVELEQWGSRFDGPNIELEIDSCARHLPDLEPPVREIGDELFVRPQ